jgi:hypothetical protein
MLLRVALLLRFAGLQPKGIELMSYNGWKNWATWQINLWIDNEEPMYRAKQRDLRRSVEDYTADDAEKLCTDLLNSYYGHHWTPDMDQKDLKEVDWQEIADYLNEERKEYAD